MTNFRSAFFWTIMSQVFSDLWCLSGGGRSDLEIKVERDPGTLGLGTVEQECVYKTVTLVLLFKEIRH